MGITKITVEVLTKTLSEKLPEYGFPSEFDFEKGGGVFRRRWTKKCEWRSDVIEMVYKSGYAGPPYIIFYILFPQLDPPNMFAGSGMRTAGGPMLFLKWRMNRWAVKSWATISNQIEWFDRFSSIEKCYQEVDDFEHRNGPMKGPVIEYIKKLHFDGPQHHPIDSNK